ncbi:MAG: restriction endonuclease subunit S, partial [Candidatus Saccharibacteria bacterium]|nr:restriction endonuclease subunit S [Candidatus Saccharibacteria bacterium]
MRRKFTDIVEFSGKACSSFDGKKSYISTGCVHDDHICKDEIEAVDYSSKPSRANLVVKPGDILFAKMQAT